MMVKKSLSTLLLVTLIITGTLFFTTAPFGVAQTATVITSNTTWSKANSPITLQGNVLVKDGATLTIEAGVTVNFENYYLRVEGGAILNARGTSSNQINFKGTGDLSGIELIGSAPWNEPTSSGTIIENAFMDFASLNVDNAKVSNSVIKSQVFVSGTSGEVSYNKITGNLEAFGTSKVSYNTINGDVQTSGSPNIAYNSITGEITISGYDNDSPVITHNEISKGITQLHACPTISYNIIHGKVALSGGPPTVTYNTLYGGISLSDKNATISNNNLIGPEVGISTAAIFQHIYVTISNNVISGCTTAGIEALDDDYGFGQITFDISGNVIKGCNYGGNLGLDVEAKIQGNLVMNNKYGVNGGSVVEHNTFANNEVGVVCKGTVAYNNFENNQYGVSLLSPRGIVGNMGGNATYNWWGTTDVAAIKQTLYDSKNDFNLGTITFEPFLTSPDSTAPSTAYTPQTEPSSSVQPTSTPEPSKTVTPTPPSTQTTATPNQPDTPTGTLLGLDWRDLAIVLLGVLVAVLVLSVVLLSRRRRVNVHPLA